MANHLLKAERADTFRNMTGTQQTKNNAWATTEAAQLHSRAGVVFSRYIGRSRRALYSDVAL